MRVQKIKHETGQRHLYSNKGMISLLDPSRFTMGKYEIYCLDGNLFDDVERFDNENDALIRCKELLDD